MLGAIIGGAAIAAIVAWLVYQGVSSAPAAGDTTTAPETPPQPSPDDPGTPGEVIQRSGPALAGGQFDDLVNAWAARRGNVDPNEIKASIQTESSGNANGSNPGDPSWGLMGVEAPIARFYLGARAAGNAWHTDPALNIEAGSGFLSDLKRKYADAYPLSDPSGGWIQIYNLGEPHFLSGERVPRYQATWEKWLAYFSG